MHILILGGTGEANALAGLLAVRPAIKATFSLAGRTRAPVLPPIAYRIGGFGGAQGLAAWMREQRVTALVNATHPFARHMSFNAAQAAAENGIPILSLLRPEWQPGEGDQWTQVANHEEAIAALGFMPRRVFLTVGRLELAAYANAPEHFYLARTIDEVEPKPLRNAVWLTSRAPFTPEGECRLMIEHAIDTLITKNSGGSATEAKLVAARMLGLSVILTQRPARPDMEQVEHAQAALDWIARVHGMPL